MSGFIAVHLGAGYHSPERKCEYNDTVNKACQQAISLLKDGASAVDAVSVAVSTLEDSPCTNAGLGSNLTIEGSIECDAGIMDGDSLHFGAVGALGGIRNPVKVAKALLCEQRKGLMSYGRIPPCVMVGNGALQWARDHGFKEVNTSALITPKALSSYRKHKRALSECSTLPLDQQETSPKRVKGDRTQMTERDTMLDTVGAVCVDSRGQIASAVSSGGIALKHPGRVGHAMFIGCGCWAQSHTQTSSSASVGCSTSGSGEQLLRCNLARTCCEGLLHSEDPTSSLGSTFQGQYLKSPLLPDDAARLGGAIAVRYNHTDRAAEILWTHSTDSLCLGYMDTTQIKAKMVISRLPTGAKAGSTYTLGGATVHLPLSEEPP
ncbi:threonine aspartase 1-like [Lytechinus variegatus]|uniref:threonine aspartase 1-like n=1 Tax=Lytechinus variegatus TaxID=7654 RepID=UPI001BB13BBF|nr:threonine aspartase 1-like [Lytechinus variegatus]